MKKTTKIQALVSFLIDDGYGKDVDLDPTVSSYDDSTFEVGNQEYMVLTDEESARRVIDYIRDSVWAFNADFIASHCKCDMNANAIKSLRKMQAELCEDANDLVMALIADFDSFVSDAISADGRGHFLNTYDGKEIEHGGFYIYRIN